LESLLKKEASAMPFLSVNGDNFFFTEAGKGELVVLIHGSLGDYRDWERQIEPLSKSGFRAFSYSRRNHFPNPWKEYPSNYSLKTERDDLAGILKVLGETAHLIGHSYGGYVAALVARDYPDLVKTLVIAEPPIFTLLDETKDRLFADSFLEDVIEPAKKSLRENSIEPAIKTFLEGITGSKGIYEDLKPKYRKIMLDNSKTALAEIEITRDRDPFDCEDASRISAPALLLKGASSPNVLQSIIVQLGRCIPNSKVENIPKASHGMIWDNSKHFNEKVIEFLKEGKEGLM
jgi:non-heme chloroperoxidase